MRLIVLQEDAMVQDVLCGSEAVYIGSRPGCRVRLHDERVPPQHAVVYPLDEKSWVVEPLTDAATLLLNGAPIDTRTPIRSGDELRVVEYVVRIYPEYEPPGSSRVALGTSRAQLERFAQSRLPPGAILRKPDEPLATQPHHLDCMGRASAAAASCLAVEELMDVVLQTLLSVFVAHRVWLGVRRVNYGAMDYEEGRFITGQAADAPEFTRELRPRVLDRAQYILVPRLIEPERTSLLVGPLIGPDGTLGMVYLDSGDSRRRYDVRDLDLFVLLLTVFAHQLDAIFKTTARNRAAMIDGQVSVAHEIQARLTPRKLPQWEGQLQFGAFREPGRERSGDIYDVVRLSNGLAAVMLAHSPAAGAMPSMLMVQAQTAFRAGVMHQDTPAVCLRTLNWMTYDGQKDHPLECFIAVIDPPTGKMSYASAGSLGAFVIGQRGEERPLGSETPLPPLGAHKSQAYPLLREQLEPGETLVLFTPGVTTAKNQQDEPFGRERFVNILCDGFGQLASAMLKDMLTDLRSFTAAGSQPDDITVLLAHRL